MKNKIINIITIGVLVVAGYFGFLYLRWFLFTTKVREMVDATALNPIYNQHRWPTKEEISGIEPHLIELARSSHIPAETFKCEVMLRPKNIGGADKWWFIVVVVQDGTGSWRFEYEKHDRCENDVSLVQESDWLENHHVKVLR